MLENTVTASIQHDRVEFFTSIRIKSICSYVGVRLPVRLAA
nr:MAG TPA: modulin Beta2 Factor [Caudoviricetes sp.]